MPYTHARYYISCRNLTLRYYPDGAEVGDSSFSIQRHLACRGAEHPAASQGACARGSRQPRRVRREPLGLPHRRAGAGVGGVHSLRTPSPQRAAVPGLSERSAGCAAPGAVAAAFLGMELVPLSSLENRQLLNSVRLLFPHG